MSDPAPTIPFGKQENNLIKFKHDGISVELDPGREKATVKTEDEDDGAGDDE